MRLLCGVLGTWWQDWSGSSPGAVLGAARGAHGLGLNAVVVPEGAAAAGC